MAIRDQLESTIHEHKRISKEIESLNNTKDNLKAKILEIVKTLDIKKYECIEGNIKVTYPKTFDFPMMISEESKELTDKFWETVTTTNEEFDKNKFRAMHPEIVAKYMIDQTVRLTIS